MQLRFNITKLEALSWLPRPKTEAPPIYGTQMAAIRPVWLPLTPKFDRYFWQQYVWWKLLDSFCLILFTNNQHDKWTCVGNYITSA